MKPMFRFYFSVTVFWLLALGLQGLPTRAQTLEPLLDMPPPVVGQPAPLADERQSLPEKPVVLTGSVRTLDAAIREEENVDWYGWYLAVRNYLGSRGGLQCEIGTPIRFFRSGHIQADTYHPACLRSVMGRRFPLPKDSQLSAVVLPVRSGKAPPASKEELYHYIRGD